MNKITRMLLVAVLCAFSVLAGCTSSDIRSSGRPVNPETDPGGQGMPGSRTTGANTQGTPGRP